MCRKRVAEVIVDVPSINTDKPFSYLIPSKYETGIEVGMRVQVPFGKRQVQGYIIRLQKDASISAKLKNITEVLDLIPSLTPEMIELGHYMKEEYLCHTITAIQSMIPAVLKGKTRKKISLHPSATCTSHNEFFNLLLQKGKLDWDEAMCMEGINLDVLRRWIQEKEITVEEAVKDRVTIKKATWVWMPHPEKIDTLLEKVSKNAKQQHSILHFFATSNISRIALVELLDEVKSTRQVVKKMVEKGWLCWEEREQYRDPFQASSFEKTTPLILTDEQSKAYFSIVESMRNRSFHPFLLQGVTGSGKTEIYLQAIQEVLSSNRETIVLVPEISLTPQMVERFKGRFGSQVAVLHSRLSNGERYDEWRKIRENKVKIAIGARSAIFAPFENLGLIIIDEEHESSYKQEENPKYDAREIALRRAKKHHAVLVLGSATPALDSYYRAQKGNYTLIELKERVYGRPFPSIELIDMRDELKQGNRSIFSEKLYQALEECFEKKEQVVLFLNRRGFSTFVICRDCGEALKCTHCDITLTFHQSNHTLRCHYCGYAIIKPENCPSCQSTRIRHFGTGTQKIEHELKRCFPSINIIRMDVDTTSKKGDHERLLSTFSKGEANVLLGTQMIAKGLDFPNVTLVGVMAADTMLHIPDYRAAERTFQLLVQVSGRAGRHEKPGKVLVQTYDVDHYSIKMAGSYQIESFYRHECMERKKHAYPPYCGLYTLLLSHQNPILLNKTGQEMVYYLKKVVPSGYEVLGPVPPPIPRIKDRYRLQILIKILKNKQYIKEFKTHLRKLQKVSLERKIRLNINGDSVREV